ncbi:MAG: 1-deoxy-D-xylulose-5-phosphate synthase [Pelosinus sp.]|nr:1-deoxy-D-xylulose-5-phosphate synthase [Pelosinus sp.]
MTKILDRINRPQDIKNLSFGQLTELAGEIRGLLIHTTSKTGGHLAPSLGVVELTLAIHKVFDSPKDKVVWDVGHQAYVHKILTGRRTQFDTLRQLNGLSGFPKRSESIHDAFGTGHSSTSISSALGLAVARDLSGENSNVLAVIGDGSLTGGLAYEALNHAGHLGKKLIVIVNDNEMSIAKNVGAMSEYLSKIRTEPTYTKVKRDIEFLLKRIPAIGESVAKTVERLKDSLRYLLVPGVLFEELGFTYVGPIDGHNLEVLTEVLTKAKDMNGPVLIHVITCKGKGYLPAEHNPDKFHGVGPFSIDTGEIIKKAGAPSYTSVFGKTLVEIAEQNKNVVAITAAMPEGTGLKPFSAKFPDRFFDVGIAEAHAVTFAAGLACQGKKPVVALYSTFAQRAYDQMVQELSLQKLSVVLALDRAGIVGEDGPTHHGLFDYAFLRHIPNMVVMAPKDENELRHMLFTAFAQDGPVSLRYPRGAGVGVSLDEPLRELAIGKAEKITSVENKKMAFFAIGAMVAPCVEAAALLEKEGIPAAVINARFVKPLDEEMIRRLARDIGMIVTVEDGVLAGGFGSAVLEYINSQNLNWVKVLRLGIPDKFVEHGKRSELLEMNGLTAEGIKKSALEYLHQFGAK